MKLRFIVAAAATLATLPAVAAEVAYSDRASFNAAAGAVTTEDFNACTGTTSLPPDTSLSATSLGPCSALVGGISYSPDPTFNLYIAAPGQSANATTALGVDFPVNGNIRIAFDGGSSAFAADFNQNFGGGDQSGSPVDFTLDAFDTGGVLLNSFVFSVASGTSTFFGLTSTTMLGSVWVRQARGFAVMDNVSFAGGTPVPEPGTLALLGLGLAVVAGLRRRA